MDIITENKPVEKLPFTGGCVCGAIRYECSAVPLMMLHCHCRDCQRSSGGSFSSFVVVPKNAFTLAKGSLRFYASPSQMGGNPPRFLRRVRLPCPGCSRCDPGYRRDPNGQPGRSIILRSADGRLDLGRATVVPNGSRPAEIQFLPKPWKLKSFRFANPIFQR